jgi:RNA polymerase sigma-70 factor (ECF subfamily)
VGAAISHALSTASASGDALPGLPLLQAVDAARREHHLPWWAAQAHLLERAGRREEALMAYDQALRLARSSMLRRTLAARRDALRGPLQ